MIVAACVATEKLTRLRDALPEPHRLHVALDWAHGASIMRRQPVDVLVVDPRFGGDVPASERILALRADFRSVPMVVYTDLDEATVVPLAALGRDGVEALVLHGIDDDEWQLRRVLESQPGVALAAQLIARLRPTLKQLPPDVSRAIERVIHTPAAFDGVPDLAVAAHVSRRTIYRECERAAIASPREIIAASRVLRAYAFLHESDHAIEEVAETLGFSSPHHLTKTMRWACGMTTARARERIGPDEFVALLAAKLLRLPEAVSA